ncbi:MAG: hypothetical protein COV75_09035 [Candidatus Omnitrophica bacterium CG11_big_fil_rev_8_21_14_0_20_63_9]|nr:MAG: hypothetical protein COV75_09035 [Candidatus Omnitrophica bacterium CG11_big_fil_rev_8_21_14_0_20_63_9]
MTQVVLLAFVSCFCWWHIRLLGDLRTHLTAFYAWFALACSAYLATLWLIGKHEKHPRFVNAALVIILLGAVAFRLCVLGTTPTLSDDIYRYRWDGRVQQAGINPYAYAPNHPRLAFLRDEQDRSINFPHLRTIYPPLAELSFRLGAMFGGSLTAHKAVFVAAETLLCLALLLLLRQRGLSPLWIAAYAWHPLAVLEVSGSGHNDVLGVAMLWWGIVAWQSHRWLGSAAAWSLAFNAKFGSSILAPWWWFRRRARGWLGAFFVLSAIPIACCPSVVTALFESLSAMTGRFESNSSAYLLTASLLGRPGLARWLVTGLWAAWLLWWARRSEDPVRYVLGAFGAAALLSPVLHPWYLLWIVPCFCFIRPPAFVALTLTVVLAYTVWPVHLLDGRWHLPLWARLAEYLPVLILGLWQWRRTLRPAATHARMSPEAIA